MTILSRTRPPDGSVATVRDGPDIAGGLATAGLRLLSAVLGRLPDAFLHQIMHRAGVGLYLIDRRRRRLVRANLGRVCRSLAERDLGGSRVAAAARDPRALERLVRDAFGHYLRTYLEVATVARYDQRKLEERLVVEDPEVLAEVLAPSRDGPRGTIVVGLHFGALEVPALTIAAGRPRPVLAPMEVLANPALQRYLERSRGASGVRIIPLAGAGRQLRQALARDEVVGLVADRDLIGTGLVVSFFGAPARLPIGPALLAVQSGARAYVVAARRDGWGTMRARIIRLPVPAAANLRDRIRAILEEEARLFELLIADAPEQWWSLFFPIWSVPDGSTADRMVPR